MTLNQVVSTEIKMHQLVLGTFNFLWISQNSQLLFWLQPQIFVNVKINVAVSMNLNIFFFFFFFLQNMNYLCMKDVLV